MAKASQHRHRDTQLALGKSIHYPAGHTEAGSKIYRLHRTATYTAVPTREDAIGCYWEFVKASPDLTVKARRELKGYDLVCSCGPDEDCHADILLAIANA